MRLPRGVTGFGHVEPGATPPDFAAFTAACHEAARRLKGAVLRADTCAGRVAPNFHRVRLSTREQVIEIICNARYPLAAAVLPLDDGNSTLTFIDVPGLAEALAGCGLEVVPAADLNAPVTAEQLAGLASAEQHQAKYWEPGTVGRVLFNFWD
jgi:hypothetical protein